MGSYRQKFARRVFLLTCAAIAITQILPSLADEMTPDPVPQVSESPLATPTIDIPVDVEIVTDTSTATAEPEVPEVPPAPFEEVTLDNSEVTEEFVELPPAPKPRFADRQSILFRAPGRYLVDPRATSAQLTPLQVSSDELVMVCLSAPGRRFEVGVIRGDITLMGNGSDLLAIAGSAPAITSLFNMVPGIRVTSLQKVAPSQVSIGMGVVTDMPEDQSLCAQMPINQKLNISPLGLTMKLVKNRIQIK